MGEFNHYPHVIKFFSAAAVVGLTSYIPIFAQSIGLDNSEIGIAASVYAFAMLLSTYFFGRMADAIGRRKLIVLGLLLSSLSFTFYIFAESFISFLAVRVINGVAISIYASALVAYAHDTGHKLGKLSALEALGTAFGSVLIGMVSLYYDMIFMFAISAVFFLAAFLSSTKLKRVSFNRVRTPLFPSHILKKNLPVYAAFFIRHTAAHSIWVFWGLYLLQLGGNLFLVGATMAINMLTQFFVMFMLTDRIKVRTLIPLGTLLSAFTFLAFGIATDMWQVMLTQVSLGFSWSFLYVGSVRWVVDSTKEKATGIGILHSVMNLSMLTGPVLATAVIQFGGYRTIMFVAAAMAFASFVAFDAMKKRK